MNVTIDHDEEGKPFYTFNLEYGDFTIVSPLASVRTFVTLTQAALDKAFILAGPNTFGHSAEITPVVRMFGARNPIAFPLDPEQHTILRGF